MYLEENKLLTIYKQLLYSYTIFIWNYDCLQFLITYFLYPNIIILTIFGLVIQILTNMYVRRSSIVLIMASPSWSPGLGAASSSSCEGSTLTRSLLSIGSAAPLCATQWTISFLRRENSIRSDYCFVSRFASLDFHCYLKFLFRRKKNIWSKIPLWVKKETKHYEFFSNENNYNNIFDGKFFYKLKKWKK